MDESALLTLSLKQIQMRGVMEKIRETLLSTSVVATPSGLLRVGISLPYPSSSELGHTLSIPTPRALSSACRK